RNDLETPGDPTSSGALASLPVTASLEDALALMMRQDEPAVAVMDGGQTIGVLTPSGIHAALRRSVAHGGVDGEVDGTAEGEADAASSEAGSHA
ncbi:MAG: hypothetical protein ACRDOW_08690, partial [Nocardioidaceae bacterium]